MKVLAHTDMDDVGTCGSRACKHMANMQDKIGNGYVYRFNYFILRPLTCGTIVKQGGRAITKKKLYMIMGGEHHSNFLRCSLEKPLTHSQSSKQKNNLS